MQVTILVGLDGGLNYARALHEIYGHDVGSVLPKGAVPIRDIGIDTVCHIPKVP